MLTYLSAWITVHTPARTERGASAVEYALLIVGVAMASYAMLRGLGMALNVIFEHAVGNVSVEP